MASEESEPKPVTPTETEVLRENAEKFKLFFDRSPLPKWVVELETLRFLDVNETAVEHYGYSREEFFADGRPGCEHTRCRESAPACPRSTAVPSAERDSCQHRKKNGEVIDVELRSSEITYGGKRVWLVSVNDITERKRAEEALRRAVEFDQAVMTNMGEGLYTVDAQGLVTSMNPAAEKLLGWKLDELRGKRMHDMTHYKHPDGRPFPAEECTGFRVLREGKRLADHEDVFIRKDGTSFDVVYSSSPLYEEDKLAGLVVVFRDVSERKRAEEALRKVSNVSPNSCDTYQGWRGSKMHKGGMSTLMILPRRFLERGRVTSVGRLMRSCFCRKLPRSSRRMIDKRWPASQASRRLSL